MSDDRQNLSVRPDLHRRVKIRAAHEGKSVQEMTQELLAYAIANKKTAAPTKK